jgi:hypothetical protein
MADNKLAKAIFILTALLAVLGFAGVQARAQETRVQRARALQAALPSTSSTGIPDDVQLVNADVNPTIRIPVGHSSLNWTLIKPRIRASYGWVEIDRNTIRYTMSRPSRNTKEPDQAFAYSRTELTNLVLEFGASEFRAGGLRHFFGYSPQNHWDLVDSPGTTQKSLSNADNVYSPLILRALQGFDSFVMELKRKQQAATPPPVVVQPEPPAPKPVPPSPPTLVVMAPSGAGANQTVDVNESTLTIRGVAMDESGLPTITINGAPASLRPKSENVAEFWSDPISLKSGANPFEIEATSPAKATSHFQFIVRYTPKTAPANPRALGKDEIISLLQGGVPDSHVTELVKDRGIKFVPTSADMNDIRAAGGGEDLIQAVQQAAAAGK